MAYGTNMPIDYLDVFPILANALPDFPATEQDWQEPLPYIFMSEIVTFVCTKMSLDSMEHVEPFIALLEKLLTEGDGEIRYLVMDALEFLDEHKQERELISSRFGSKTLDLWRQMPHLPPSL